MGKIKSQKVFRAIFLAQAVLIMALFAEYSVRAWVEPTTSPPGGNIAAPLNTGSDSQQKSGGGLWIYGNTFGTDSRGTSYGSLGYETDTGAYGYIGTGGWGGWFNGPVYSTSYIQAPTICIGAVCQSSWPSSVETLQTVTNRGWTTTQPLYTSNYAQAPIFYDANNSGYYVDPNSWSWQYGIQSYDIRSDIFYDRQNTGYYVDPNNTSNINAQTSNTLSTGYLDFRYAGSNSGQGNNAYAIFQEGGSWSHPYPDLRIAYHTGIKLGANASYNGIRFYNDYNMATLVMSVNDSATGGANNVYIPNIAYVNDLRASIMYDWNNTGYYVDPNSASRLNYGVFDNVYSYGWMQAPIFYDSQDNGYYVDPNGTTRLNILCISGDCRGAWPNSNLYLPLAGGVMNAGSRVGFNGGTSYGIGQAAASPNLNSIAVDTLETDGGVGGSGTLELNYYGGNAVTIGPGGTKPLLAAIMYDGNNTGYYVDPNGETRLNKIRSLQGNTTSPRWDTSFYVLQSTHWYGQNSTEAMYLGESNPVLVRGDIRAPIFYDYNNTGYYVDPNSTSRLNYGVFDNIYSYGWMQAPILYDSQDTGYYVDPNGTTRLNILCISGDCRGAWPTVAEADTLQTVTNRGWTTSQPLYSSNYVQASIYYDSQNSDYRVDPNGTSRMNQLYYVDSAYVVDLRPQYMYDWNDTNYYIDMNSGSRFNYLGRNYGWNWTEYDWNDANYYMDLNNVSSLNDLRVNILYDRKDTSYYVDPNGNSVFNYAEIKNSGEPTIYFHRPGIFATGIKLRSDNRLWFGGWSAGEGAAEIVAGRMLDGNNTGYYVDPNGSSRMNQLYYVDSAYVVDLRPQYMYDWNDTNYYIDMNSGSRFNYLGRNYGWNWTEYDWNDTTYYMDLNNVSILNDLRVNILYDRQNTGYYVDPNGYSNVYAMQPVYSFNGPVYDYNNGGYYVDPASTTVLNVAYANQYNCMSDINLKKDIQPIGNALEKIVSIKGVNFNWKDEKMGAGNQIGVIAQDVEKVLPEIVSKDGEGYKAIDYTKLSPLIIEAIKEMKNSNESEINDLKRRIDELDSRAREKDSQIYDLRRRIEIIEAR